MSDETRVSPSRRYVALLQTGEQKQFFRSFTLPEDYPNDAEEAYAYLGCRLDFPGFIVACYPIEEFPDLEPDEGLWAAAENVSRYIDPFALPPEIEPMDQADGFAH